MNDHATASDRAELFTTEQLAYFAKLAKDRADREAADMYPPDELRNIKRKAFELQCLYFRQYVQPPGAP